MALASACPAKAGRIDARHSGLLIGAGTP